MPTITVSGPKRDVVTKRKVVESLTASVAEIYGVPKEAIIVVIQENDPENVGVGGVLIADRKH